MHWIIIFGILLILILGIIITMIKIIRGSNDLQEMRERPSGRDSRRGHGGGNRNRNSSDRSGNDRSGGNRSGSNRGSSNRSRDGSSDRGRSHRHRDNEGREGRHAPAPRPGREARGGIKRRWKVILIDVATHEEYEFIFSDAIGIGRAFAKDGFEDYLVINDPKVSKRHCSLFAEFDNLFIQDERSSNGTYVNNQRVNRPMMVQKEDVINIGNTDLEIFKVFRESR